MNHLIEWNASCVDEQLTQLNVTPLEGYRPLDYLLYSDTLPRRNDGRVSDRILKRYQHLYAGGWWCSGIDILTGKDDLWGCFKPLDPRIQSDRNKLIKYEHPPQTPTGIFALRVSQPIWERMAKRYSLKLSEADIQPDQSDLGFWEWVIAHPQIPLCITEGAKKAGALLTAGYAAIALPGIYAGYRVPKDEWGKRIGNSRLIPQLQKLATPKREIYIVFDQDHKPSTIKAVDTAIKQTGYLLTQKGCSVKVVTWNSKLGKGVDDLISNHSTAAFEQAYKIANPLETWRALSFNRLTYPANIQVNQRYLSDITIPNTAKLIGIQSPKGTGKTQFIEKIVQQAKKRGQWVLVISHRIRLVEALCQRFGLQYLQGTDTTLAQAEVSGYGLCIDSLHPGSRAKFNAENWSNGVVIIDEVEQVLWHGLNSDTCRHQRVSILKSLKTLMKNVIGGDGKVVVADADLSDISIDYLLSLAGVQQDPFIIQNEWKPPTEEAWSVYSYQGKTPKQLVKDLEQHIAEGGRPFVCLSAQKLASQWGTCTLETYLSTQFPEKKILRIDSESLADPTHPAYGCISQLNSILKKYDIVVASPCIETGVSIDIESHFTSVWGIAQGIQGENSVRQALGRIRENLPRYLWVAHHGFNQVGNGSVSMSSLLGSNHRLTKLNIRLLQQSDFARLDDLEMGFQAESLLCWAKMAVRFNAAMSRYRDSILAALEVEGHQILEVVPEKNPPVKNLTSPPEQNTESNHSARPSLSEMISAVRDQNYQAECQAIAQAKMISDRDYRSLQKKLLKTTAERRSQRKYELSLRYRIPVTHNLVEKDDRGWYEQLRIHYFLTVGRPYLSHRDVAIAHQLIAQGQGYIFVPDFNRSQLGATIGIMELLGIPALIHNSRRELKNTDVDLQQIAEIALRDRQAIKSIIGIGLAKSSSPIMIIRRLLDRIGYGLECLRVESDCKKRIRVYGVVEPDDERQEVFQEWLALERQSPGQRT
ncbi:MAG: plasmid replication protein, CyRepA1 family, partial [Cyanobacteriota bacterium]|nr:plasmid replication protein, CyRepA1 family [Cyanobacteriota bacterium]